MAYFGGRSLRRACPALWVLMTVPLVAQNTEPFRIDAASTNIMVHVGRAGVFGFAGHDHEVAVPAIEGTVTVDRADVGRSSLQLEFDAAALKVTGKGEPAKDVAEVQRVMTSERVLDVRQYPKIIFQSRRVALVERAADRMVLRVDGELTLHGVTRRVSVPVTVRLTADRLTAQGQASVRQTDFGIQPVTAAAGTVRVKDQVDVIFTVIARRH